MSNKKKVIAIISKDEKLKAFAAELETTRKNYLTRIKFIKKQLKAAEEDSAKYSESIWDEIIIYLKSTGALYPEYRSVKDSKEGLTFDNDGDCITIHQIDEDTKSGRDQMEAFLKSLPGVIVATDDTCLDHK